MEKYSYVCTKIRNAIKGLNKKKVGRNMEYLYNLNTRRTLEHIEGDILLTMPNIPELDDPNVTDEMLEKNKEIIMQLEDVIMLWGVHIEKV